MRRGETLKFFWRTKKEDGGPAAAAPQPESASGISEPLESASVSEPTTPPETTSIEAEPAAAPGSSAGAQQAHEDGAATNVVTLQPARLSERIAAAAMKTVVAFTAAGDDSAAGDQSVIEPMPHGPLPGQEESYVQLARALENRRVRAHVLVDGPAGTGRRTAVRMAIEASRASRPRPDDWIYVTTAPGSRRLEPFALPHGQGTMFVREVRAAIERAAANHDRLILGDEFRLGLELIDEEFRHRAGTTLDHLKRRAEGQNIALVKTPEGFVLAPMHEGKVVRSDVFRSLPESLQRDVEAKIAGLEGELKSLIEQQPAEDAAYGDRVATFAREAATRAVRPQFGAVRLAFSDTADVIDIIEAGLVAGARSGVDAAHRTRSPGEPLSLLGGIDVLPAQTANDFSEPAPVVYAHEISERALLGEIATDVNGRLTLLPGHLMRANGGYLVVDAWRLAAEPRAWLALSAALERDAVAPCLAPGLALEATPVPLAIKLIVLADDISLAKLATLDPGFMRHFPHSVKFSAKVPRAAFAAGDYGRLAAAVAEAHGLKPLAAPAAETLYRAAHVKAGSNGTIHVDTHALVALLSDADLEASASGAAIIRARDIEAAARRLDDGASA